jgi:hypothetical protein
MGSIRLGASLPEETEARLQKRCVSLKKIRWATSKKRRLDQLTLLMLCSLLCLHDLVMEALIGLRMVWFEVIWFGTSYTILNSPTYLGTKFKEKSSAFK